MRDGDSAGGGVPGKSDDRPVPAPTPGRPTLLDVLSGQAAVPNSLATPPCAAKSPDVAPDNSRLGVYLKTWAALLIIFCIARFVLFANSTENAIFWVTSGYMITVWVGVAAAHLTENQKFLSYLRSEHPLHGESCGFAPANGFRLLPFVWSEDDLGDIEVTRLKLQYRRVLLLGLAVFLHMPVIFLVSMIAASMK